MSEELVSYIFKHFSHLQSETETQARRTFLARSKAAVATEKADAAGMPRPESLLQRYREMESQDPSVHELVALGWAEFRHRVARRILAEHPSEVFLNLCERCGGLARTPRARQCPHCGRDWH